MRRWIPTFWLGFVILRYGSTVIKALRAPFNPGLDVEWARAWLFFLLAMVISTMLLRPRTAYRLWLALTVTASASALILSHTWVPALTAAVILTIAAGCGEFILEKFGIGTGGIVERLAVTMPMGIGVVALGQLGLALGGLFSRGTSWGLLALLAIPGFFGVRGLCRCRCEEGIREHPVAILPLAWIFFLNLLWAMAPEIQFDAGSVHLAVPRIYLDHGGVVDLPYFFHSYFVHLLDMVFGLCLSVGGQTVAKFLVLSFGVTAAGAVFVLGQMLFDPEVGAWAALIFYTTPLVIWLSGTAYMDLAETCFIAGALIAFIRWFETRSTGWLAASGWITGVAVGVKLHALTVLGVLPLAIAWWSRPPAASPGTAAAEGGEEVAHATIARGWIPALRALGVYVLALVMVAAPWYAVIYAFTGNPVYPFMNATFRSAQWAPENTNLNASDFGIGASPLSLLRLPFWLTWDSGRFGEGLPRGGVGFALLLAFPLSLVFLLPKRLLPDFPLSRLRLIRLLLACMAVHLALWAVSFQYGRYYVPLIPVVAVVGCGVFLQIVPAAARWNRILLFVGVVAQVPVASLMFWNIPERFPLSHGLGRETSESLLRRGLLGYRAVGYLNGVIRPGEKVLGVGVENLRFYLKPPLYTLAEAAQGQDLLRLINIKPGGELADALGKAGFTYIVTPMTELHTPPAYYPYLQPEFIGQFETSIYLDGDVEVFRICPEGCGRNNKNDRTSHQ